MQKFWNLLGELFTLIVDGVDIRQNEVIKTNTLLPAFRPPVLVSISVFGVYPLPVSAFAEVFVANVFLWRGGEHGVDESVSLDLDGVQNSSIRVLLEKELNPAAERSVGFQSVNVGTARECELFLHVV